MTFNKWFESDAHPESLDAEFDRRMAKAAWNAAISAAGDAIESVDYNADDSGIGAISEAATAVGMLVAQ